MRLPDSHDLMLVAVGHLATVAFLNGRIGPGLAFALTVGGVAAHVVVEAEANA